MKKLSLNAKKWRVRAIAGPVPAALRRRVFAAGTPGCVHTSLIEAGAIPNPVVGLNERAVQWVGECDWEYRRKFTIRPDLMAHQRLDLVCDGLDTIAELTLNDIRIGAAANMFHPHRFDVRHAARAGENELVIVFRSPLRHIRAEAERLGPRPVNGDWEPYNFIRKAACNFGWDWAPKLATAGIWKNIGLEAWSGVRIEHVRPVTTRVAEKQWRVGVHVDVEVADENLPGMVSVKAVVRAPEGGAGSGSGAKVSERVVVDAEVMPRHAALRTAVVGIEVDDPALWWPRGHGEAARYRLDVMVEWTDAPAGLSIATPRPEGARPLPGAALRPWRPDPLPSSIASGSAARRADESGHVGFSTTRLPAGQHEQSNQGMRGGRLPEASGALASGNDHAPSGRGEQSGSSRRALAAQSSRSLLIAFRAINLDTSLDEHGSRFTLEVNGRPIFCKGANWIPEGAFPADRSPERIHQRLDQAAAANMNMLRVWGGGFYESDEFYDHCDRLGLMVWQDFMFACAMYPEEAPYPALVEAEARHQVARLASHPSVVLWCGGNECVWAHDNWGAAPGEQRWRDRLQGRSWGAAYYFDLLPRIVKELAPGTPYWPSSPWNAATLPTGTPNDASHGDRHTWDARLDGYRAIVPRFCSEFGQQSPANYATLARVMKPEELRLGSPALEHRQRGTGGTAKHINEAIAELFGPPQDFDQWHYLAQLVQARSLRTGIEWLRANQPRCTGALLWQLNDCWPGMSWSLVDSDGRDKPAYHAVQEAMRPRHLTIQPFDGRPVLVAVNDSELEWSDLARVRRIGFDGSTLAEAQRPVIVRPWSSARIADLEAALGPAANPTAECIVADASTHRAWWFHRPDRELAYPSPRLEVTTSGKNRTDVWNRTRIVAHSLLRDVMLSVDRLGEDCVVCGPQCFSMLPGQSVEVRWLCGERGPSWIDPAADRIGVPPVLWCANWFGRDRV